MMWLVLLLAVGTDIYKFVIQAASQARHSYPAGQ